MEAVGEFVFLGIFTDQWGKSALLLDLIVRLRGLINCKAGVFNFRAGEKCRPRSLMFVSESYGPGMVADPSLFADYAKKMGHPGFVVEPAFSRPGPSAGEFCGWGDPLE